jgi:hypothetical protein
MAEDTKPNDFAAARREGLKMFYDVFKHLTTLSSGSILLLVTFLAKANQQQPSWRPLVAVSFIGFLVCSVASIVVMLSTARTIRRNETTDLLPDLTGRLGYCVAVFGFAVGVLSLTIFGWKNL